MKWTQNNIPDLSGKVAIVTGANSGLGLHATQQLAKHGCLVVMACRDLKKAECAKQSILEQVPQAKLIILQLDLADLSSVANFVDNFKNAYPLSLLLNNAGVMNLPFGKTQDGFEMHFGINHLGHFALTGLLLPLLLADTNARVVTVSSIWHRWGHINFGNLQSERKYSPRGAYSNSKLANLLFAFELNRRIQNASDKLISVAAHPGYADTNLQFVAPNMVGSMINKIIYTLGNRLIAQSAAKGALPLLYASTALGVKGGDYYGPDGLKELKGFPILVRSSQEANNREIAQKLWEVSEKLTGIRYLF